MRKNTYILFLVASIIACGQNDGSSDGSAESEESGTSWNIDQLLSVKAGCVSAITGESSKLFSVATTYCSCVIEDASTRWSYEEFVSSEFTYVEELKENGVIDICLEKAGIINGWTIDSLVQARANCVDAAIAAVPNVHTSNAAVYCGCTIEDAFKRWDYSSYILNETEYTQQQIDDGIVKQCIEFAGISSEGSSAEADSGANLPDDNGIWSEPSSYRKWAYLPGGSTAVTWEEANSGCSDLVLGGYRDWTLPSVSVLQEALRNGLNDSLEKYRPLIASSVWTSDLGYNGNDESYAKFVYLDLGASESISKTDYNHVICSINSHTSTDTPKESSSFGQLVFTLGPDVRPTSVTGYIVGHHDILKVFSSADSKFFISNVPEGMHDLVVLGTTTEGIDIGVRKSRVSFLKGNRTDLGEIQLSPLTTVTGAVKTYGNTPLNELSDHKDVLISIRGTDFETFSDSQGNYNLHIPEGSHDFLFSKEGFHKGGYFSFNTATENLKIPEIRLIPATGDSEFIIGDDGSSTLMSNKVTIIHGPSEDITTEVSWTKMKVSENESFDGSVWKPIITTFPYIFEIPNDHLAWSPSIWIKYSDGSGQQSDPQQQEFLIDPFQAGYSIVVNQDEAVTSSRLVAVTINYPNEATEMMVSILPDFSGSQWEAVSNTKSITLINEGEQTVYLKLRSDDGILSSVVSDTITLDIFPFEAGGVVINDGAGLSTSLNLSLSITVPDMANEMMVSQNPDFAEGSWEIASTTKNIYASQQGTIPVYVKFRDNLGIESEVWDDAIIVDLFLTDSINYDLAVSYPSRNFILTNISGPVVSYEMIASLKPDFSDSVWTNFQSSHTVSAASTCASNNTIYLKIRDNLGNESESISTGASVDCTPLFSPNNLAVTSNPIAGQVTLSWDSLSEATSYNIYYSDSSGVNSSNGTKVAASGTTKTISGLNSDNYYFIIAGVNPHGESNSFSNEVSALPYYFKIGRAHV